MTTALLHADSLEFRARMTLGSSSDAIYALVVDTIRARGIRGGCLVDVGCGQGALWSLLREDFAGYCGIDAVRYDRFPPGGTFTQADLDRADWDVDAEIADLVVALETIEHLENPWAFMRGLARLAKPGAWVIVTTPNQLSWLSLLTLALSQRFSAFADSQYPAHRTALLEVDLERQAAASGLEDTEIRYTCSGRLPKAPWHYPRPIARRFPRALSDNLLLIARKPVG